MLHVHHYYMTASAVREYCGDILRRNTLNADDNSEVRYLASGKEAWEVSNRDLPKPTRKNAAAVAAAAELQQQLKSIIADALLGRSVPETDADFASIGELLEIRAMGI